MGKSSAVTREVWAGLSRQYSSLPVAQDVFQSQIWMRLAPCDCPGLIPQSLWQLNDTPGVPEAVAGVTESVNVPVACGFWVVASIV